MPENIVVVAGSGVAAAAGLPATYGHNTLMEDDEHFDKMLSSRDYGNYLPELWEFSKTQALQAASVTPSAVHQALADSGWPIITQNIGGIQHRAGTDYDRLVEVYGSYFEAKCLRCQQEMPMTVQVYQALEAGDIPACVSCGKHRTRPSVTLPGEGMRHKRRAEKLLREATHVVYVGVEENSGPAAEWYHKVPQAILVSEERWGSFNKWVPLSPNEWALEGMNI